MKLVMSRSLIAFMSLVALLATTSARAQDAIHQQQSEIDRQQWLLRTPMSPAQLKLEQLKHQELLMRQQELSGHATSPAQQQQLEGQRLQLQQQQLILQQRQRDLRR